MYDKRLKDEFWTSFGKYMALSHSATGEKQHWLNYKTGVRYLQFRMDADEHHAMIAIELANHDEEARQRLYNLFLADRDLLTQYTNEAWNWENDLNIDGGRTISKIYRELKEVNVYRKTDWPAIISFLKPAMMGLDLFWTEQKEFYQMIAG